MRRFHCRALAALAAVYCVLSPTHALAAQNPDEGDIRNLQVDKPLSGISDEGYVNFACGNNGELPGKALQSWNDYAQCTADAEGLFEVSMHYDDDKQQWASVNDKWEGTKIAGHPVILSMLIDSDGIVRGLRAVTDPSSRAYLKKKAYLLSYKVKSRYGKHDWSCNDGQPVDGATALGGLFINESCSKQYNGRTIRVSTQLFRAAGQQGKDFTNSTRLEIRSGNT